MNSSENFVLGESSWRSTTSDLAMTFTRSTSSSVSWIVSEVVSLAGPELKGVFTGGHLLGLVNGHLRGAAGNIASCELSDVYAQIWDLMDGGEADEARALQDLEAVFYRCMRTLPSVGAPKRVLVRRGVFSSDALRNTGRPAIDDVFEAELDHALEVLAPYLRV